MNVRIGVVHRSGERRLRHAALREERICADGCHAVRDVESVFAIRQGRAAVEHRLADCFKTVAEVDAHQVGTVLECTIADPLHVVGERDALESRAVPEDILIDFRHGIRNRDILVAVQIDSLQDTVLDCELRYAAFAALAPLHVERLSAGCASRNFGNRLARERRSRVPSGEMIPRGRRRHGQLANLACRVFRWGEVERRRAVHVDDVELLKRDDRVELLAVERHRTLRRRNHREVIGSIAGLDSDISRDGQSALRTPYTAADACGDSCFTVCATNSRHCTAINSDRAAIFESSATDTCTAAHAGRSDYSTIDSDRAAVSAGTSTDTGCPATARSSDDAAIDNNSAARAFVRLFVFHRTAISADAGCAAAARCENCAGACRLGVDRERASNGNIDTGLRVVTLDSQRRVIREDELDVAGNGEPGRAVVDVVR